MPEGDTILRTARTLQRAIGGAVIASFESRLPALRAIDLSGRRVDRVESKGKHLLIHFDDGRILASHMGMSGSWHIYRPGERWRVTEGAARAIINTTDFVAVCFSAPHIEMIDLRLRASHPSELIGPDILGDSLDEDEILRRFRLHNDLPLGEAVLSQGIVAGIGNIWKSETLFTVKMDPFAAVSTYDDTSLIRITRKARALMSASVADSRQPAWVYRRSGEPCRRCGTIIEMKRQGSMGRSTYYCPKCQPRR